ncbi:MAG: DUF6265 family protein [Bacteroidota bacterium]
MKEKQDIFQQFKEKSEHLEEIPSSQTWERLEERLQRAKRPKAKVVFLHRWAVAASLLVVLSIISVLSTFLIQSEDRYAEAIPATEAVLEESLVLTDAPSRDIYSLQNRYVKGQLEEGNASKKLVAAVNYFYKDTRTHSAAESLLNRELRPTEQATEVVPTPTPQAATRIDFDWLIGSWKGKIEGGNSLETWRKVGGIFYGEGYLMQASDTVFMERMKLVQKGKDWFYILQLDPYSNSSSYQLESANPRQMIFSNTRQKFPAKVMLIRNENGGFSTHLLARNSIELSPTQLDFLTRRNVLLLDKAVRNLVRI